MKITTPLLLCLLATMNGTSQKTLLDKLVGSVSETSLKKTLNIIAGNEFEGRMAGSKGDSLTVNFISTWFNTHHIINPYKKAKPYLQSVPLIHSNYSTSTLAIDGRSFVLDSQWTYFNGSINFNVTAAEVVFIGYGISTTNFDELNGIDIKDKVVVIMPEFPNITNANRVIDEKDIPDQGQRIMNIISKKPQAVLIYTSQFINILNELKVGRKFLPYFKYQDLETPPAYPISSDVANYIVNGNIDSIYTSILRTGKPNSFNTNKKITLSINRKDEPANTNNVVGVINGTNANLPCIVLTAHHDHEGIVNNLNYFGADDNGSGTTALLEISKILGDASVKGIRPKRSIVFISTAAEEQGLIGSYFYAEHPIVPLSRTYCSINIDMVGRVDSFYAEKRADSNYIYAIYNDRSKKIFNPDKLQEINKKYSRLNLDTLYDAESKELSQYSLIARSDNFPFMQKGIPAIWFFSGFHKDYHKPTDTPDKINYSLFKRRTQFALATLWQVANE